MTRPTTSPATTGAPVGTEGRIPASNTSTSPLRSTTDLSRASTTVLSAGARTIGAAGSECVGTQVDSGAPQRRCRAARAGARLRPRQAVSLQQCRLERGARRRWVRPGCPGQHRRGDRQVDPGSVGGHIDDGPDGPPRSDLHRQRAGVQADCVPQRDLGQRERHRRRAVEDQPVEGLLLTGVVVVRISRDDVVDARGQDARAGRDQRPHRCDLRLGQRCHGVESSDDRARVPKVRPSFPHEQRGDGRGQIGDQPAAYDVAEVDHAARREPAGRVPRGDHVVVGQIGVHDLHAQVIQQRGERSPGSVAEPGGVRPPERVGHRARQSLHDAGGVSAVVLERAVGRGVVERGQRCRDSRDERAEPGQHLVADISGVGEHLAGDEGEHADVVVDPADRHPDQLAPVQRRDRDRDRQARARPLDVLHRLVLQVEHVRVERRIGDLQHVGVALCAAHPQVGLLVGTQWLCGTVDTEDVVGESNGLVRRHLGSGRSLAPERCTHPPTISPADEPSPSSRSRRVEPSWRRCAARQ